MTKYFLKDSWTTKNPIQKDALEALKDMTSKDKNGPVALQVIIDATHSGLLTNNRVYPGRFVSQQYKTFFDKKNGGTAEYNKPVLTHHDNYSDPIGRTINAEFIKLKDSKSFDLDYLTPDEKGSGSGLVRTTNLIVDPDAIQKIADERYLSVSAGFRIKDMLCSVCGSSLLGIDSCEHWPGNSYETEDGEKFCYGITGPQVYLETSFVNVPAQSPAKIHKIDYSNIKTDSEEIVIPDGGAIDGKFIHSMTLTDSDTLVDLLGNEIKSTKDTTSVSFSNIVDSVESLDSSLSEEQGSKDPKTSSSISDRSEEKPDDRSDKVADKNDSGNSLQASYEALSKDKAKLEDQYSESQNRIKELEDQLESVKQDNAKLTEDMQNSKAELVDGYARLNAHYRVKLNKPGYVGLDDESLEKKIDDELKVRSVESLKDSLDDLILEDRVSTEESSENDKDNVDLSDEQLTSPGVVDDKDERNTLRDSSNAVKSLDDMFDKD